MSIRIAVIGLGKMGVTHLAILKALDAFQVVAICDTSRTVGWTVGRTIEKYGQMRYLDTVAAVLALPDLDAVAIATPTGTHGELARAALLRGLHVFCEMPLTLSPDRSRTLADLAAERGLVAQVAYQHRATGTFAEAKRLIACGALGPIGHVLAQSSAPTVLKPAGRRSRSTAEGGGCLANLAAHAIDLLGWHFGAPIACDAAVLDSGFSAHADDRVAATLTFRDGIVAQVAADWSDVSRRRPSTRLSISGAHGRIEVDRQELRLFLAAGAAAPEGYAPGWTIRNVAHLTPPVEFYLRGEEFTAQLEAFANAVQNPAATSQGFADAAVTDAMIAMIRDAAANAPRSTLPPPVPARAAWQRFLRR